MSLAEIIYSKQEWLIYMSHYLTQEASALCQQMNFGDSMCNVHA